MVIIIFIAVFCSFLYWGFKSWKSWGVLFFTFLFDLFLLKGNNSESEYYKNGYNAGYETGKYDSSMGRGMQSEAEKSNTSGLIFMKKYYGTFSSEEEKDNAYTEHRLGYFKGYNEGFFD